MDFDSDFLNIESFENKIYFYNRVVSYKFRKSEEVQVS